MSARQSQRRAVQGPSRQRWLAIRSPQSELAAPRDTLGEVVEPSTVGSVVTGRPDSHYSCSEGWWRECTKSGEVGDTGVVRCWLLHPHSPNSRLRRRSWRSGRVDWGGLSVGRRVPVGLYRRECCQPLVGTGAGDLEEERREEERGCQVTGDCRDQLQLGNLIYG